MGKLKIVLIEWRLYKRAERYSLGLNYIDRALKDEGFDVHTIIFEDKTVEQACEEIVSLEPDVVGLKFYSETSEPVFEIARLLKQHNPQIKVVTGGHTATLFGALILKQEPSIDIVVNGEGEQTFIEICKCIEKQRDIKDCEGIIYRNKKGLINRNKPRKLIDNLDKLSLPEMNVFLDKKKSTSKFIEYAISTARGCAGNCYFCVVNRVYAQEKDRQWRGMTPEKIIDEIEKVVSKYYDKKVTIKFVDSAIEDPKPKSKKRLEKIIQYIEERNIDIAFSFFTRAESWSEKDEKFIKRMKKAGLYKVSLGFDESIKPYSFRSFTEKAISEENKKISWLFQRNGIQPYGYLILLHPFITIESLEKCAEFLDEVGMSAYPDVWTHEVILYPDTRLFGHVVQRGLLLGQDKGGYSFNYACEDSRVTNIREIIREVKELKSFQDIRNSMLKIDKDLEIYNAWNSKIEEMKKIEKEMEEFKSSIDEAYKEIGSKQKHLFTELINSIVNEESYNKSKVVKKWDSIYLGKIKDLEKIWLQNRLRIGRKRVSLD